MNYNQNEQESWKPDKHVRAFQDAMEAYEKDHPQWRYEVLFSFVKRGLFGLKQKIEDRNNTSVTWDSPFAEFYYPVEWDWNTKDVISGKLVTGKFTAENTRDAETTRKTLSEMLVRHLNTLALQDLTNHVWLEKRGDAYGVILPPALGDELQAIKGKRQRQELLEEFSHPFSIGAALIDYGPNEPQDGEPISKRAARQLAKIDKLIAIKRIDFSFDINGRHIEMSLVFQIHPLAIDYEKKRASHSITVGLFMPPEVVGNEIFTTTPSDWIPSDIETLWKKLFQDIDKIIGDFIPKAERQTSAILSINADIEMPFASLNEAQKKALDALQQLGLVKDFSIKSVENNDTSSAKQKELQSKEQIPESFGDVLAKPILKSRFLRWPVAIIAICVTGAVAVYAILPDEVKLKIWNHLVKFFHAGHP